MEADVQGRPSDTVTTLVDSLSQRSVSKPSHTAFAFVQANGQQSHELTFAQLDKEARSVAAMLRSTCEAGDRALLLFEPALDFVVAFMGCMYANVVAVPAHVARRPAEVTRLDRIAATADVRCVLSTEDVTSRANTLCASTQSRIGQLPWLTVDAAASFGSWEPGPIDGSSPALLQFTSGSTGHPRGVVITHDNLFHNQRMIQRACSNDFERTIIVGWLPVFHDMGLSNVTQALFLGRPCVLMSPLDFLQRPALWLETISRYRATSSGGPSFGYEMCVKRVTEEQKADLDLSSWSLAYNGAEVVRSDTIERFNAAFAGCGFSKTTFYPCYGLAEATLLVTGGERSRVPTTLDVDRGALEMGRVQLADAGTQTTRRLVGCGTPWLGQELRIVDPEALQPCPGGVVGEIWISGDSVARGYWNDSAATARTFDARLADGAGPFLRTGDLGFVHDDELFITGRIKGLIVIRGKNHSAEDIEHTVSQCSPWLKPGGAAAFSIEADGDERLVVVHEVLRRAVGRADLQEIRDDIRAAITANHGVSPYEICLVLPGAVPKTSSGKVRRHRCQQNFVSGDLDKVDVSQRRGDAASSPDVRRNARP